MKISVATIRFESRIETMNNELEKLRAENKSLQELLDIQARSNEDDLPTIKPIGHVYLSIDANRLWDALREECCTNPKTAVRCVLVSRADFDRALTRYKQLK